MLSSKTDIIGAAELASLVGDDADHLIAAALEGDLSSYQAIMARLKPAHIQQLDPHWLRFTSAGNLIREIQYKLFADDAILFAEAARLVFPHVLTTNRLSHFSKVMIATGRIPVYFFPDSCFTPETLNEMRKRGAANVKRGERGVMYVRRSDVEALLAKGVINAQR